MRQSPLSTPELCQSLLIQWRENLQLNNREKTLFAGEFKALDNQLDRLSKRHLRIAAFGRVGVGKSSLLNALLGQNIFPTDVAHGCTRKTKTVTWSTHVEKLNRVELIDTPGIDEIAAKGRSRLASRIALNTDLVIFVLDSDLNVVELDAIDILLKNGKPLLLVLNRCDQWKSNEIKEVVASIRHRLPSKAKDLPIEIIAAAPRKALIQADGRIRSQSCPPKVSALKKRLQGILEENGDLLLALNALKQAENFYHSLKSDRLKRRKIQAQSLIGKFATIKATGVAANPLLMVDIGTGLAIDTTLIIQLSKIYGLHLKGPSAKRLVQKFSIHNTFLGGAQIGLQVLLGAIKHLLLVSAPFTGGLTFASTAPVALAQAAIAVHTTKLLGQLAAKEFLRGNQAKEPQPSTIMRFLIKKDPKIRNWLSSWPVLSSKEAIAIKALLP